MLRRGPVDLNLISLASYYGAVELQTVDTTNSRPCDDVGASETIPSKVETNN